MDEEIGHDRLLERGVERLDELVGKLPNEADGVGEQERSAVGEVDLACRRVERGEEGVLHEDVRPGEATQEGGLARIGVADDRGVRHRGALAVLALIGAVAAYLDEVSPETVHLAADLAFVLLELAFAFALRAYAAALLAKMAPGAGESRQ